MVAYSLVGLTPLLGLVGRVAAIPFVSQATTTFTSAAATTLLPVPVTNVTSHGPYTGPPPTTTGALSTEVLAPSIPALPPLQQKFDYPADGKLHAPQPAPYTPNGGLGTNGSAPVYRVQSDFDYQSVALALYQEWIELDLFNHGLAIFSDEDFEAANLTAEDRYLIQFMAEQEVGHATVLTNMLGDQAPKQCAYNYPFTTVREFIDFNQKLTRFGESGVYGFLEHLDSRETATILLQSITTEARQQMIFRQFNGQFPMPVWFETGIPQSWAWTLLAPYISSCPEGQTRLIWQNFPKLNVLNQPNAARTDGSNVWNDTIPGDALGTLSTANISSEESCGDACGPAITHNRSLPLSYPGRKVFLSWDEPGQAVGPNNSYVTSTSAGEPKFAAWVSQLNVTYTPLEDINGCTAFTIQPNVSTIEGDPAANGTMFLALTDLDLFVTPFNLSQINPHVRALSLYQAG
ncbi:ferritin-like domain-domain-containing protein [Microdochium bolleyi]|uniref:Ferritin-like domain-domain-containing protein n=1 Tax=Microdochium bolleyi TaxID=196109 RepID=A0A136IS74_9PEZI|nr:ferritin-like domain-domain-containing protein [Microdochium bolleyi]